MKNQKEECVDFLEEYNTQYFSFGRNVLKESLSSLVESKFQSQIDSARSYFTSLELSESLKEIVTDKCTKLLAAVLAKSQVKLEDIFQDLDKHFHVPDKVLLPQDEMFKNNVEEDEIISLKKDVENLKLKIMALNASQIVMEKELVENSSVKKYIIEKELQLLNTLNGLEAVLLANEF